MTGDILDDEYEQRITASVDKILATRGPLDQVKGMLMVIYGIDDREAFEMLRSQARRTNNTIHAIAAQFLKDVASVNERGTIPDQPVFDQMLRTGHERIRRT